MPSRSLVESREKQARNFKTSKDELSCLDVQMHQVHASFHWPIYTRLPSPAASSTLTSSLPVHYFSQRKSWMDMTIFSEWFHNKFVPHIRHFSQVSHIEYKNYNAPAHPSTETLTSADGKVTTCFLHPNCTVLLQPMGQGILDVLKQCYKNHLLRHKTDIITLSAIQVMQLTIEDIVYWCVEAWEKATPLSLSKGFLFFQSYNL